jgi:hypothetical protein
MGRKRNRTGEDDSAKTDCTQNEDRLEAVCWISPCGVDRDQAVNSGEHYGKEPSSGSSTKNFNAMNDFW